MVSDIDPLLCQGRDPESDGTVYMSAEPARPTVAVIGSGVSGLTAAYRLSEGAQVTLFEAEDRIGGHADTSTVLAGGGEVNVDTGFIVHNDRTYPVLLQMFDELGVRTRPTGMSMSVRADSAHGGQGLEYAGARGPAGLFGDRRNLLRPAYLRMLWEIPRFHRTARQLLASSPQDADYDETLGEFLRRGGFSDYFIRHFAAPLIATVWSCDPAKADEYPLRYLLTFLHHHGMLRISGSPHWRTVVGGSREYVRRIVDTVTARGGHILTGTAVSSIRDTTDGVLIGDGAGGERIFDAVIIAAHPDQALRMLAAPTGAQQEILSAIPYSHNVMQLHTDTTVLPRNPAARAAWNHLERGDGPVVVTYDMTRLMDLPTPGGARYLVTLNAPELVDPETVVTSRHYSHPIYTPTSVAASSRASELDTDRVFFAGAWQGWGFHEDGARSGAAAARRALSAQRAGTMPDTVATGTPVAVPTAEPRAQVLRTTVTHTRSTPVAHRFRHRSWMWLVDLDHLPERGLSSWWLGSFLPRDHFPDGGGRRSIRDSVLAALAVNGVTGPVGRIRMAAMPRAWGNGFNPLSVFWCDTPDGQPLATVMEVQNTYGDRHAYVVHPDETGRTTTDKEFYVSPFHGTDGEYGISVPQPVQGRVSVAITLRGDRGDDSYRFTAAVRGQRVHDGEPGWLDMARAAPAALRTATLIRVHGIWLWLRRLPLQPRPTGGRRHRQHERQGE